MKALGVFLVALIVLSIALTACQGESTTATPPPPALPVVRIGDRTEDIIGITTTNNPNPLVYSLDGHLMLVVDNTEYAAVYLYMGALQEYWYENYVFLFEDVTDAAASKDKQYIALALDDEVITVWDTSPMRLEEIEYKQPIQIQTIEAPSTLGLAFSYNVKHLLSLTQNRLSIWDWQAGMQVSNHDGEFTSMAASPIDPKFVVAHPDGSIDVWAIGTEQPDFTLAGNPGGVRSMVFSPDGRILASGGNDNLIHLWDASDGSLIRTLEGHSHAVRQVSFFPEGVALASLGDDALRIWHTESGHLIHSEASDAAVTRVLAVSPMAPIVYLGYADGTLFAWDIAVVDPDLPTPDATQTDVASQKTLVAMFSDETPEATSTSTPKATPTTERSPEPSATTRPIGTATHWPSDYVDAFGVPMIRIPAGPFPVGADPTVSVEICRLFRDECSIAWFLDEEPVHWVELDDYLIDQFEVTNARYAECVDAGVCDPPDLTSSATRDSYYGNPVYDDYPVIYVSWEDADAYCAWRGARLPTETEWETAARGGLEGLAFPWGDEIPACETDLLFGAHFDDDGLCDDADTAPVGSYWPNFLMIYDMSGNVLEWTADWYNVYPGGDPDISDEFGEIYRVARGGSWYTYGDTMRVAIRFPTLPSASFNHYGFRCALSE